MIPTGLKKNKVRISENVGKKITITFESGVILSGTIAGISKGITLLKNVTISNTSKEVNNYSDFHLILSKITLKGIKIQKKK